MKNESKTLALTIGPYTSSCSKAGIMISNKGTQGQYDPSHLHLLLIMDSKVISLVLIASSVSSQSDRSEGSKCSHHGRHHRETRGRMKINSPIFKDKDMKDAITYKSWRWDLIIYHWAGCQDCTLLPYTIQSLQGYPRELMRSSRMDITLDNMLTIFDKHYNNVKALDALNQELFQL